MVSWKTFVKDYKWSKIYPLSEIQNLCKYHGCEFKGNHLKVEHLFSPGFSKQKKNCLGKTASNFRDQRSWWKWSGCSRVRSGSGRALSCCLREYLRWGLGNLFHCNGGKPAVILKKNMVAATRKSRFQSTKQVTTGNASEAFQWHQSPWTKLEPRWPPQGPLQHYSLFQDEHLGFYPVNVPGSTRPRSVPQPSWNTLIFSRYKFARF